MSKQWFYQLMGDTLGPVSSADLKQRVQRGVIQPDTMVRAGTDGKWLTADRVKGLFDPPAAPPPPAVVAPAAPTKPEMNTETTPAMATSFEDDQTYHVAGDHEAHHDADQQPHEFDFFRFVGFEQAIGPKLHKVLLDHCQVQRLTLTQATQQALAAYLNRKDLLEEPAEETTTATTQPS